MKPVLFFSSVAAVFAIGGCGHVTVESPFAKTAKHEPIQSENASQESSEDALARRQAVLIRQYIDAYVQKDAGAVAALFGAGAVAVAYPVAMADLESDFSRHPNARMEIAQSFRLARDQKLVVGELVDDEARTPMWAVFDFDAAGSKIDAMYVHRAVAAEPSDAVKTAYDAVFAALAGTDFAAAAERFSAGAELYAYPPTNIANHTPVITGASDVASVLAFKWGEGAWRDDVTTTPFGSRLLATIPGDGVDRAVLFTFDDDPDSPSFNKIVRVDVMGPPGG
ncbi:MAG: hypothetical protein AAGA09_03615 [Pseudomonadota bacterium]